MPSPRPQSPSEDQTCVNSVQVPSLPLLEPGSLPTVECGLDWTESQQHSLQQIDTNNQYRHEDQNRYFGHRHTRSLEGQSILPMSDPLNSASSDSAIFSRTDLDNANHIRLLPSLNGPYISLSSRKSNPALSISPAPHFSVALPSSSMYDSPVDELASSSERSAMDEDSEAEDAWDLRPYDIPWGNSYYGYKDGTLPGPDGACIFLRSPIPLKYQRTGQACDKCRERKAKCTGSRPACSRCANRGLKCTYASETKKTRAEESADEEKSSPWTAPEARQFCQKPRTCRRMTLSVPESMPGYFQNPDLFYNYESQPEASIQSTLRRSHSTTELSAPGLATSPQSSTNGFYTAFERRSNNPLIHHDAERPISSDEADAYTLRSHSFDEDRSVHRGLAPLTALGSEVSPHEPSITYANQAESWSQPRHLYGDGTSLHTMQDDSGDLDCVEQDSLLPTGLPMVGPLDSMEDYYTSFDPYLEPASMNVEMHWSDSKGLLPNDGPNEYTEQTLSLFAFQQRTLFPVQSRPFLDESSYMHLGLAF